MFGHNYIVTRNVTLHVKEYTCTNCKKELTTNSNGTLIELTPKFKEINDVLERIYQKRSKRQITIARKGNIALPNKLLVFSH